MIDKLLDDHYWTELEEHFAHYEEELRHHPRRVWGGLPEFVTFILEQKTKGVNFVPNPKKEVSQFHQTIENLRNLAEDDNFDAIKNLLEIILTEFFKKDVFKKRFKSPHTPQHSYQAPDRAREVVNQNKNIEDIFELIIYYRASFYIEMF